MHKWYDQLIFFSDGCCKLYEKSSCADFSNDRQLIANTRPIQAAGDTTWITFSSKKESLWEKGFIDATVDTFGHSHNNHSYAYLKIYLNKVMNCVLIWQCYKIQLNLHIFSKSATLSTWQHLLQLSLRQIENNKNHHRWKETCYPAVTRVGCGIMCEM